MKKYLNKILSRVVRTFYSKTRMTRNFTKKEYDCNCGCNQLYIDVQLMVMAEAFRAYLCAKYNKNVRIDVHCVNRCYKHNRNVGGSPRSKHLWGKAMDLHSPDLKWSELKKSALECHTPSGILWGGLGIYANWKNKGIHIDTGSFRNWNG